MGLVMWSTGPVLHVCPALEPPGERPLPATHHMGQANQPGSLHDVREPGAQVTHVQGHRFRPSPTSNWKATLDRVKAVFLETSYMPASL